MEGHRGRRSVLAIGGLLTLAGVVAVAAAGRAPGIGETRPSAHAPTLLADYIATLGMLLVPAGLIVLLWGALMRRVYAERRKGQPWAGGVRLLVGFAAVAAAVLIGIRIAPVEERKPAATQTTGGAATTSTEEEYRPQFRWLPIIVVGSLIVGIGGAMGLLALRRQRELLESAPVRATLAEVLRETLDDLRRERDPRKAVIGAYSKMVETLAARGVPRRESEAPLEYLARILDVVRASEHSVRRLTSLFERARFSPHEIDEAMKEDAIEALTGLRAELGAAL